MSRHPERASYELDTAFSILDEGLVAHVGLTTPDGVVVLPMTYARIGNKLYLHGAVASRWLAIVWMLFVTGPVSEGQRYELIGSCIIARIVASSAHARIFQLPKLIAS